MRIWALQRPDLNRLQKTITTACDKERYVRPQERAFHYSEKQILNVRPRENSKTERILLAKNRREKNPQLPAKQGRAVTSPSPGIRTYHLTSKSPSEAVFIVVSPVCLLMVVTCIQVELMRIWALQRPDLNRLQKTDLNICPPARKSVTNCPRERASSSAQERALCPPSRKNVNLLTRNESSTSERKKAAKPNGSSRQKEKREESSPAYST